MLDKNVFASAGIDLSIKFWNTNSGTCIHTIENAHSCSVLSLLYSNKVLISAGSDNAVKVWELNIMGKDEKQMVMCTLKYKIINPFCQSCRTIAFLGDGSKVLVGDDGGHMLIVDLQTGACEIKREKLHASIIWKLEVATE